MVRATTAVLMLGISWLFIHAPAQVAPTPILLAEERHQVESVPELNCVMIIHVDLNLNTFGSCAGEGLPCSSVDGTCAYSRIINGGFFGTSRFECSCGDFSLASCHGFFDSNALFPQLNEWFCVGFCSGSASCQKQAPPAAVVGASLPACSCQ